jgi:hypothetical protein
MWWHTLAHGGWGNWRMQWVASTPHTTPEHGVSSITTAYAHTSAFNSRLNWRPPAYLNGLVRFAERRNLVTVRVQSHFKRSLLKFVWVLMDGLRFYAVYERNILLTFVCFNLLGPGLFFLILAHPVYKMWIIQEPNKLQFWNKLHFEENKRRVYTMFKIFGNCICWINI